MANTQTMSRVDNGPVRAGELAYVFDRHDDDHERARLKALQEIHDPTTIRLLSELNIGPGMACLEIGVGEGSIARHLAAIVGPTGKVVGIDINPRFVTNGAVPNLEVRSGDIASIALETGAYDLVHARLVMLHVSDRAGAMRNICQALKPGGVLLLEEPNLRTQSAVAHDPAITASIERVYRATFAYYETIGMDTTFGLRVPALLEANGFKEINFYTHTPLAAGGSTIALMRGVGASYIATELINTGLADGHDIAAYIAASHDPRVWTMYYATVSAWGYKPRA